MTDRPLNLIFLQNSDNQSDLLAEAVSGLSAFHHVIKVDNISTCLEVFQKQPIDLILVGFDQLEAFIETNNSFQSDFQPSAWVALLPEGEQKPGDYVTASGAIDFICLSRNELNNISNTVARIFRLTQTYKNFGLIKKEKLETGSLLEQSIQTSSNIIFVLQKNKVVFANDCAAGIMDVKSPSELLGLRLRDKLHEESKNIFFNQIEEASFESQIQFSELQIVSFKDRKIWIRVAAIPVVFKAQKSVLIIGININDEMENEKLLQLTGDKLGSILHAAPIGIGVTKARVILEVNDTLCGMTGYLPAELIGQSSRIFYPSDEEFDIVGTVKYRIMAKEGVGSVETIWKRKDGSLINIFLSSSPIDAEDISKGVSFTALDLTEQKKNNKALQESEEKFRLLAESSLDMIVVHDLAGMINYVNPAFLKTCGYSENEVLRKSIRILLSDEDLNIPINHEEQNQSVGLEKFLYELRMRNKQGGLIPVEVSSSPIIQDGKVKEIFLTARDISERRSSEKALRESEERFRSLVTTMEQGVALCEVICDAENVPVDYRYIEVNSSFEKIRGIPRIGLLGKTVKDLTPSMDPEKIKQYGSVALTGIPIYFEQYEKPTDNYYYVVVYRPGENQFAVVISDITQLKKLEKEVASSKTLNEQFMDTSLEGIVQLDTKGNMQYLNQKFANMFKGEISDFINKNVSIFILDSDLERHWTRMLARERECSDQFEQRLKRLDGEIIWTYNSVSPIIDEDGIYHGSIAMLSDITERKNAEETLRINENRLRRAESVASFGNWEFNIENREFSGSEGVAQIYGIPHDPSWSAQFIQGIPLQTYRSDLDRAMKNLIEGKAPYDIEFKIKRPKDGRFVDIHSIAEYDSDRGIVFGVIHDITARKQVQDALKASLDQSQLHLQRLKVLHQIDNVITGNMDFEIILKNIFETINSLASIKSCILYLTDENQGELKFHSQVGVTQTVLDQMLNDENVRTVSKIVKNHEIVFIDREKLRKTHNIKNRNIQSTAFLTLTIQQIDKGVLQIVFNEDISLDDEWKDFLKSLAMQLTITIDRSELFRGMETAHGELAAAYDATLEGWSLALELREKETAGHSNRVVERTLELARHFGFTEKELVHIQRGALLHDIGKMGIPDNLLLKPGPLTSDEWVLMRQHPVYAHNLLKNISYLKQALDIPYCHHERWNGSGYPQGLKESEIPLAARIFAVVDVWDALTKDRPYRLAWPDAEARRYLKEQKGIQFDPEVVDAFLELISANK